MTEPRIIPTAGTSKFIRDYIAGAPAIAPFYTGHPHDIEAYRRKSVEVRSRMDAATRQKVADAYRPLNDEAKRKLDDVLSGNGFVVTTGQQAGVFSGPLYTVYKALSAARLAAELETQLRCTVLPVFWIAADDHDWAEVDHVRVLDGYNYLRDVRVGAPADDPPWPMSRKKLGGDVTRAIDEFTQFLPPDGFGADARAMLRRTYVPGRSVADAFEEMMAELLAPFPIAIVSSAHPSIKRASLPLFVHELSNSAQHEALVTEQTRKLEAAGYAAQVDVTPDASNVFLLRDAGRDRLLKERDAWLLRRTGERIDDTALLETAKNDPEALSANVFFRPVVESAVFPTLSYVGGPAETAYFAQIGCLFEAHGIMPPVVFPRHGLTVIEPKASKTLEKFGYDVDAVRMPFAQVVKNLVRAEMPAPVRSALDEADKSIGVAYAELENAVPEIDPTLIGPVRTSSFRARTEVRRIEKQVEKQFRTRNAERIEQLRRAAASIFPDGAPQERVLNITPFLAAYGPGIVREMYEAMPVSLDRDMPEWSGVLCDGSSAKVDDRDK